MLIGDSHNDYEAALSNNIAFMGYNNPKLKVLPIKYLNNFFPNQK